MGNNASSKQLPTTSPGGTVDSSEIEADMGDPDEFPDDKADELRDAAEWLDLFSGVDIPGDHLTWSEMVEHIFDEIEKLLGDHRVARDLAIKWGTCTTVADVTNSLVSANGEFDQVHLPHLRRGRSTSPRTPRSSRRCRRSSPRPPTCPAQSANRTNGESSRSRAPSVP